MSGTPQIKRTVQFGWIHDKDLANHFDDLSDNFPENYEDFVISKIRIFSAEKKAIKKYIRELNGKNQNENNKEEDSKEEDSQEVITEILFTYKNINKQEEEITPREREPYELEKITEFNLENGEYITNFDLSIDMEITKITFYTSLDKEISYGPGGGSDMKANLTNKKIACFSIFGSIYEGVLEGFGMTYYPREKLFEKKYNLFFNLKAALDNDETYKENIKNSLDNLNENEQTAVRVGFLSEKPFNRVMNYLVHK